MACRCQLVAACGSHFENERNGAASTGDNADNSIDNDNSNSNDNDNVFHPFCELLLPHRAQVTIDTPFPAHVHAHATHVRGLTSTSAVAEAASRGVAAAVCQRSMPC